MRSTAALLCLLSCAPAHAEGPADLLREGIDAFGLAQFDRSRQALERARAATRDHTLLARIHLYLGFNAAVIGDTTAARAAFRSALGHDPTLAPDAETVKRELIDLFQEVRRGLVGRLVVRRQGERATALVDGRPMGELPLTAKVPIGAHRLEVRGAAGETLFSTEVLVAPDQTATVVAELRKPRGSLKVHSSPSGARVSLDGKLLGRTPLRQAVDAGDHQLTVQTEGHHAAVRNVSIKPAAETAVTLDLVAVGGPAERPAPTRRRIWTWVAGGAAVAALAAGVALGVSASSDFNEWEGHCASAATPSCTTLQRDIEDRDLAANVLFGVAAGLVATSVVLYFVEGRYSAPESRRVSLLLGPLAGIAGAF